MMDMATKRQFLQLVFLKSNINLHGRQQPLVDVSTHGHGQGEGPARYEFRASGTKEIVGGAEVSEANGVPPEAVACPAFSDHVQKYVSPLTKALG